MIVGWTLGLFVVVLVVVVMALLLVVVVVVAVFSVGGFPVRALLNVALFLLLFASSF